MGLSNTTRTPSRRAMNIELVEIKKFDVDAEWVLINELPTITIAPQFAGRSPDSNDHR